MSLDHQNFVQSVQDRGGFPDPARVEASVAITLECLGQRLSGGNARALAEHLPEPAASQLTAHANPDEGLPGGATELAEEIARRAGLDTAGAHDVLQATVRAVVDAVGDEDQLNRVRDQLPPDLAAMFGPTEESGGRFRSAWTPGSEPTDR